MTEYFALCLPIFRMNCSTLFNIKQPQQLSWQLLNTKQARQYIKKIIWSLSSIQVSFFKGHNDALARSIEIIFHLHNIQNLIDRSMAIAIVNEMVSIIWILVHFHNWTLKTLKQIISTSSWLSFVYIYWSKIVINEHSKIKQTNLSKDCFGAIFHMRLIQEQL